jgi:mycothiol synthase
VILRRPAAGKRTEADAIQAVWERSHGLDDPGGRPRGGWSVDPWSTDVMILGDDERIVGVAAVRAEPHAEAVAGRIALDPDARTPANSAVLVHAAIDMACHAQASRIRLFVPAAASWAVEAARSVGFDRVRSVFHMLLPADVVLPEPAVIDGVRFRRLRDGEENAGLQALNRNWAGTWDFVPIRAEMLAEDLAGQRQGMLLGVDASDDTRIVATCHGVFDTTERNPDGGPRAWISNVTVDPASRGRGIARAILLTALHELRARGAGSITLGVDGGDPAPLKLYLSTGFQTISSTEAWDRSLDGRK